jgi:SnoaL-like domain
MNGTRTSPAAPRFGVAGVFLEALAAQDFQRLATTLDPDAALSALLPRGYCEWRGATEIGAAFAEWFGNVEHFEVADASVGQVGPMLQLRWRVRLQGGRLGDAPMIAEQHVYAATGPSGRIQRMSLLCSGFWDEHDNA